MELDQKYQILAELAYKVLDGKVSFVEFLAFKKQLVI
jgi:hypothetical protein